MRDSRCGASAAAVTETRFTVTVAVILPTSKFPAPKMPAAGGLCRSVPRNLHYLSEFFIAVDLQALYFGGQTAPFTEPDTGSVLCPFLFGLTCVGCSVAVCSKDGAAAPSRKGTSTGTPSTKQPQQQDRGPDLFTKHSSQDSTLFSGHTHPPSPPFPPPPQKTSQRIQEKRVLFPPNLFRDWVGRRGRKSGVWWAEGEK
eukprot:Hpha_TRINITY_DN16078_c3_g4::TRINITY_DN16078_c3_g4_i2::g.117712::m.117712